MLELALHQFLIQVPAVGDNDFAHRALVPIDVAHAAGYGLAERQITCELLGPRAPGLPALRRVNPPEPDTLCPAFVQHAYRVAVADADDAAGEVFGEQSGCKCG